MIKPRSPDWRFVLRKKNITVSREMKTVWSKGWFGDPLKNTSNNTSILLQRNLSTDVFPSMTTVLYSLERSPEVIKRSH